MRHRIPFVGAVLSLCLAGCNGDVPVSGSFPPDRAGVKLIGDIANPAATRTFGFDGSQVYAGKYYLADRNVPGLTVVDVASLAIIAQVSDPAVFPGQSIDPRNGVLRNDLSGPNGLAVVTAGAGGADAKTGLVYLGSNNSVAVVDVAQKKVVASMPNLAPVANPDPNGPPFILLTAPDGNRADGVCYDPVHRMMMAQHPDESPTYVSFHDVDTQKTFAVLPMPDGSLGLEGCVYDAANNKLLLVNDGTSSNGSGELDILDPVAIAAKKGPNITILDPDTIIVKNGKINIPCNGSGGQGPLGIDINTKNNDAVIGCDPPFAPNPSNGTQQVTVIMDRTAGNGAVKAIVPFGGSDQVAYDPATDRYFIAARRYTFNGIAQTNAPAGTKFTVPVTPSLGVINALPPYDILGIYPAGGNDHSVAVDSASGKVFVPYGPGAAAFPGAGISVYSSH